MHGYLVRQRVGEHLVIWLGWEMSYGGVGERRGSMFCAEPAVKALPRLSCQPLQERERQKNKTKQTNTSVPKTKRKCVQFPTNAQILRANEHFWWGKSVGRGEKNKTIKRPGHRARSLIPALLATIHKPARATRVMGVGRGEGKCCPEPLVSAYTDA